MKLAIGIVVGYVIGARILDRDYTDVTQALRAVGRSEELRDVVLTVRRHASHTLREMAELLEAPSQPRSDPAVADDLVTRVTDLQARRAR